MKIQLVTYDHSNNRFGEAVTEVNTFNSARVLDDFDINLIDLTDKNIWYNEDYNYNKVNCERDLQSLDALILNSQKSAILVLLPCNQEMHYQRNINGGYAKKLQLKDMLGILSDTILTGAFHTQSSFVFGISYTDINNLRLKSDFFFAIEDPNNIQSATKTESGNITTIKRIADNCFFTFVQLSNKDELLCFLNQIGLGESDKVVSPDWFKEILMFDDEKQIQTINESKKIIMEQQKRIEEAEIVLSRNKKWESVLYTQGNELVQIVFRILESMLGIDLSGFVDQKREDFSFDYKGKTVIGEIKGVKCGVKNSYISQLDNNKYIYLDTHPECNNGIVALLIINPQRSIEPDKRESIQQDQVSLAKRNGSLIIETSILLRMFEQYCSGNLSREDCWSLISENTGELIM